MTIPPAIVAHPASGALVSTKRMQLIGPEVKELQRRCWGDAGSVCGAPADLGQMLLLIPLSLQPFKPRP
jgi:hypothetical protein